MCFNLSSCFRSILHSNCIICLLFGEEGECFAPHSHGSERAPRFSSSKRHPETKALDSQGFQNMRNSRLLTIFLQDHGIYCPETDFGPILAPVRIELSKSLSECIRIYQKLNILNIYDTRSIARASFHDFTPPLKIRNFHVFQNLSWLSMRCES